MANRYRQIDHANKTWPELRADIESMIQNNRRGTSIDTEQFQDRNKRRIIYDTSTQQPHKYIRAARNTSSNHYDPYQPYEPECQSIEINQPPTSNSAATYPTKPTLNPPSNRTTCVNCGGDHAGRDCDSLTCSKCQGTFPFAALRQAHYLFAQAQSARACPELWAKAWLVRKSCTDPNGGVVSSGLVPERGKTGVIGRRKDEGLLGKTERMEV